MYTLFRTSFKIVSLVQTNVKEGGHDKEVVSSKFNTSVQKSIPYL